MISKNFKAYGAYILLTSMMAASPMALAQNVPTFTPVSAWDVGAAQLGSGRGVQSMKMPCVISGEFDNGFIVRFSGGGGELLAMAIDFRQEVFKQGRKYNAMLSVGDSYVKQVSATAFTPNTLIFNLRPLGDFYNAAKNAKTMEISIDNNAMMFSMAGLAKSYEGLENCYAGGNAEPIKPLKGEMRTADGATKVRPVVVPGVEKIAAAPLPQTFDDIVQNSDVPAAGKPMNITQVTPQAATTARVSRSIDSSLWSAKEGEDMRSVLSRWSNRAGYDLQWQADQGGVVAQDVALNGTFEEAVSQLLAENSAASGISGRIEDTGAVKPLTTASTGSSWSAAPGASIQSVLDNWAARAGVTIVWTSSINAPVKAAVNMSGSFEGAVQTLLDQYMNDSARPVGQLNVDPQTGQRTLFMNIDRAG